MDELYYQPRLQSDVSPTYLTLLTVYVVALVLFYTCLIRQGAQPLVFRPSFRH